MNRNTDSINVRRDQHQEGIQKMTDEDNLHYPENSIDLSFVRPGYSLHWNPYQHDDQHDFDGWVRHLDPAENAENAEKLGSPRPFGWKWPDHYRYEPVSKYERMKLHTLGKSDAWIDAHVHDRLVAEAVIFELGPASEWAVDNMTWVFGEVPESAVEGDLVSQAAPTLRMMQRVLQLPPLRVRWFDTLGIQGAIHREILGILERRWGCDFLTAQDEHVACFAYPTLYDAYRARVMRVGKDRHPYAGGME